MWLPHPNTSGHCPGNEPGATMPYGNKPFSCIAEEKAYWKRLIIEGMEIKKMSLTERANLQMGYETTQSGTPSWRTYKKPERHGVEVTVGIYILQMQLRN